MNHRMKTGSTIPDQLRLSQGETIRSTIWRSWCSRSESQCQNRWAPYSVWKSCYTEISKMSEIYNSYKRAKHGNPVIWYQPLATKRTSGAFKLYWRKGRKSKLIDGSQTTADRFSNPFPLSSTEERGKGEPAVRMGIENEWKEGSVLNRRTRWNDPE